MATIHTLNAREIRDSRGNPTIEVELESGRVKATASVPSGASVGTHEALELRDEGGSVSGAISHVNEAIARAVVGKTFDQQGLDALLCELDGTPNKSMLGANAILGVSIAFARAEASERGEPLYAYLGSLDAQDSFTLPQPLFNVINGGKHAHHGIAMQESMLAPIGFESARERVAAATACVESLRLLLEEGGYGTSLGDEGGFAPALRNNEEALDLLASAIARAGYTTEQIKIALDIAASSFYTEGEYRLEAGEETQSFDRTRLLEWYAAIAKKYPLISIEDGFAEDDMDGFVALTRELGDRLSIVGDDFTVTNAERIGTVAGRKAANACIIKPNQIGTITETIEAVRAARRAEWKVFASHRSGETMDTFIADFAVGLSCDYLKAGAPTRPERLVKYNRLIEIEEELFAL